MFAGITGGLVVGFLAGCAGEVSRPTAAQLPEGLSLLDAKEPAWGMNAAFRKADRVIYLESRVGPLKPEIYRQDAPEEPANEIDFRFVDSQNRTFWVQRGGDTYVDPTWNQDIANSISTKIARAEREADFDMAQEAAKAFAQIAPAAMKDHTFHFSKFAASPTPMRDPALLSKLAELEAKSPAPAELPANLKEKAYGAYNSWSWTQMYVAKYSGQVCKVWICPARHSATVMYVNPNVGYWQMAISANNHGRAYNGSGMGYDCYSWNGGGWFQYGVQVTGGTAGDSTGSWDGQGGCQTGYSWNSGGYDHLCNDDAAYELWQSKYGNGGDNGRKDTMGGNITFRWNGSGWGGDGSNVYFACNCGDFNGCDNDWSTPNCP